MVGQVGGCGSMAGLRTAVSAFVTAAEELVPRGRTPGTGSVSMSGSQCSGRLNPPGGAWLSWIPGSCVAHEAS